MLASILLNYGGGRLLDRFRGKQRVKIVLFVTLAANLLLLGTFKYANFLVDNLNIVLEAVGVSPILLAPVHLPIGISFFTFQAMSYVIDVYRDDAVVQNNPFNTALYIALFPQLIAGPIVRYHDIADQLTSRRTTLDLFTSGIILFVIGLGKKMLLANQMGAVADGVFAIEPSQLDVPLSWLGIGCYTLQIYFDFSGYSDMAIGLGRMFGFQFLINFNYPYISRSIREFWRRWHISLSRWFRDYLYIPLGGGRGANWQVYRNLFIVFFLCSLWHGASWNFIVWGMIHGTFLALERTRLGSLLAVCPRLLRHFYVLLIVMLSWVFFRSPDIGYGWHYLSAMFGFGRGNGMAHSVFQYLNREVLLVIVFGVVAATPIVPFVRTRLEEGKILEYSWVQLIVSGGTITVLILIILGSAMHLAAGTHNPFIYFRF
jgi:alginate O-acetyltransferase complex protein AlgI